VLRLLGSGETMTLRPVLPHATDPSLALVQLTKGYVAVIAAADAAAVGRWNWSATISKKSRTVYAKRTVRRRREGRQWEVSLHGFLWDQWKRPETPEIDHRDGDGLNNQPMNLRAATHEQNKKNSPLQKNNRTGLTGLILVRNGRWRAQIQVDGKHISLGMYGDRQAAADARRIGEVKYFGEFARGRQ
jgi:HNH endonuclease